MKWILCSLIIIAVIAIFGYLVRKYDNERISE